MASVGTDSAASMDATASAAAASLAAQIADTTAGSCSPVLEAPAPAVVAQHPQGDGGDSLSKKQRKKLQRLAERAQGGDARAAKKRKGKLDAKFATPAPKYSFDRGAARSPLQPPVSPQELTMNFHAINW
jgi:hypothetical protein